MSTLKLGKVSPSGGMEMRDMVIADLKTLNDEKVETSAILAAPVLTSTTAEGTAAKVVNIKMVGASGADITGRHVIRVWTSETAFGAPSVDNITTNILSTGAELQQVVEHSHYIYLTAVGGTAVATVTMTGNGTNYVQAEVAGKVGSLAIVKS